MKKILIIHCHPDSNPKRFCHALAQEYSVGAGDGGHEVRMLTLATIDIPLLRSREEWEKGVVAESVQTSQNDIAWADHVVLIFPLWLGGVPAYVKAFLEQVFRPGFAFVEGKMQGKLKGKSVRIVTTMGMPAFVYRWVFFAHGIRTLKRNIFQFVGMGPVRTTIIGMVEGKKEARQKDLTHMKKLGRLAR